MTAVLPDPHSADRPVARPAVRPARPGRRRRLRVSDVPVVDLAETMPSGTHYADWMGGYITEISTALEGHKH